MKTPRLPLFAALVSLSCSHLTAEQHRDAAEADRAAAATEEAQYDPHARAQAHQPGPAMAGKGPFDVQPDVPPQYATYNPTQHHLDDAEAHRHAATAHLQAALELERFEDAACIGVSTAARAGCPLLSSKIAVVVETARGVRLQLRAGESTDELAGTMRCHLAFARAHGYDAPSCPLYRPGVELRTEEKVIELYTSSAATAAQLRQDARSLFGQPAAVSRSEP